MQSKVLIVEQNPTTQRLLHRLASKAHLDPILASSLIEAKHIFAQSNPEQFLCAIVDYHQPDTQHGEAIDFTVEHYIPTIVTSEKQDEDIRQYALSKEVVDYIPKENAQIYDYLSRLLTRLEKNKSTGVLVIDPSRRNRSNLSALLQRHHFIIYSCATATQALSILENHSDIKLLLADNAIADIPATRFIAEVRKRYAKEELAILGLSEDQDDFLSAKFIKSGANDFIRRPFCYESFFCRINLNIELIELVDTIQRTANTDYLTGLANRRHFFTQVNKSRSRHSPNSALALFDLDHFKQVNDTYGHDMGDAVLSAVATQLKHAFDDQIVSRFGGEEFCVYFDNTTSQQVISRLQAFCETLANSPITEGDLTLNITVSIGLTMQQCDHVQSMLTAADALLYKAKSAGRNQLVHDEIDEIKG